MIVIIALFFVLAVICMIGEIAHEKDWPRRMGKYAVIFAVLLLCALPVFA